ncbi:uncharacterized protein METZ01_LOCUS354914, partial [marine metagenome]
MKLFVFIQHEEEKINPVSLEALRGAQEIAENSGGTVCAVTFSSSAGTKLTGYDIGEILVIENPQLENYNPLYYVKAMEDVAKSESPDILVFGHSYEARDWVPRLSARLDIPLVSDCIGFKYEGGLTFVRSVYQGKCNSDSSVSCEKFIISFQSGAFRVDTLKAGSASIRNISVDLSNVEDTIQPGEKFQESETSVDLTQADIIVSVGRGIAKEENLQMIRELAAAIGAEVASSRPVVDSGW